MQDLFTEVLQPVLEIVVQAKLYQLIFALVIPSYVLGIFSMLWLSSKVKHA